MYTIKILEGWDHTPNGSRYCIIVENSADGRRYRSLRFSAKFQFNLIKKVLGNKLQLQGQNVVTKLNEFVIARVDKIYIAKDVDKQTADVLLFIAEWGSLLLDDKVVNTRMSGEEIRKRVISYMLFFIGRAWTLLLVLYQLMTMR
ncbi:MAG: hypothetical protein QXF17_06675 [Ignisphaera sp.]